MTPEQEAQQAQTVEKVRSIVRGAKSAGAGTDYIIKRYESLLEIVDSQSRKIAELQRQYTEAELRAEFDKQPGSQGQRRNDYFEGWTMAFRFLRAIKEKEG